MIDVSAVVGVRYEDADVGVAAVVNSPDFEEVEGLVVPFVCLATPLVEVERVVGTVGVEGDSGINKAGFGKVLYVDPRDVYLYMG